jgi:hypothetical protein
LVELVHPDLLAGLGLERDHAVARGQVHDAADDDGRDLLIDLERARTRDARAIRAVETIDPGELEARRNASAAVARFAPSVQNPELRVAPEGLQ